MGHTFTLSFTSALDDEGRLSTLRLGRFSLEKESLLGGPPEAAFEKSSNTKLYENPSSGSRVVLCGQRDARADMTKLIDAIFKIHFQVLHFINTVCFRFLYQLLLPCTALTELFEPTWSVFTARYEMDHFT